MFKHSLKIGMLLLLFSLVLSACGTEGQTIANNQTSSNNKSPTNSVQSSAKTPTVTQSPITVKPKPTQPTTNMKATPPVQTAPTQPHWTLIYSDEFNETALNPMWGTYDGPHGGGKNYYKPNHIQVQNGQAHLSISRTPVGDRPYTSGGMATFKLAQTYGKYEFRAKLPRGKGINPYAILWEDKSGHGDVEVDLFESPPVNKDTIYFTNHGSGASSQIQAKGNFADQFHTFTYEWTPGKLQLWIDDVDQGILTKNVPDFSMWFALAVSSGDAFTGEPDASTALPVSFDIDWVRIYRYDR